MPTLRPIEDRWSAADRRVAERRFGERRGTTVAVTSERRSGVERRRRDRRSGSERRRRSSGVNTPLTARTTPVPFSRDDAARIRQMAFENVTALTCPVCQGTIAQGPPIERGSSVVREYRCGDCRRGVTVRDRP